MLADQEAGLDSSSIPERKSVIQSMVVSIFLQGRTRCGWICSARKGCVAALDPPPRHGFHRCMLATSSFHLAVFPMMRVCNVTQEGRDPRARSCNDMVEQLR